MNDRLDAALEYAEKGWRVLALGANSKIPISDSLQPNGSLSATTDPNRLRELWERYPNANVGIATGKESGITVVDIDHDSGWGPLWELGMPDSGWTVKTPRGTHIYLKYDETIRQTAGLWEHVDIRNEGGYVVAPPSTINEDSYEVIDSTKNLPAWPELSAHCIELEKQPEAVSRSSSDQPNWVTDLLDQGSGQGRRNDDAARIVGYFRKKDLPKDIVQRAMMPWADKCTPPFGINELDQVIDGIWRNYQPTQAVNYQDNAVSAPLINVATPRLRVLNYVDEGVVISADRIRQVRDGVTVWLKVSVAGAGQIYGPRRINLLSDSTMDGAKRALKRRSDKDWDGILESLASNIVREVDHPGELIDVTNHTMSSDTPWLYEPFLRGNNATLFYGDGGEGKSTLVAAMLLSIASGTSVLPGGTVHKQGPVLFLDWESDADSFVRSIKGLAAGKNITIPKDSILYRRMHGSLEDYQDVIQRDVSEHGIVAVATDSLVALAGGDVNESEAARIYFNIMRSLGVTSVGITHTTKGQDNKPFGSAFYWNYARSVFLVKKDQQSGSSSSEIGIYHQKANHGELLQPYGATVLFDSDKITYSGSSVQSSPTLALHTSHRDRLIYALRNHNKSAEDLADELTTDKLTVTVGTVRATLNRYKDVFVPITSSGTWMLKRDETPPVERQVRDSMGRPVTTTN